MPAIPVDLRRRVIERADNRCEYCGLSQLGQVATFHIDHVIPRSADGETSLDNLALACVSCSLRKGPRQIVTEVETGRMVPIFNPRTDRWHEHFRWEGVLLIGLTASGRATTAALALNRPLMLEIRREEVLLGRHPQR